MKVPILYDICWYVITILIALWFTWIFHEWDRWYITVAICTVANIFFVVVRRKLG